MVSDLPNVSVLKRHPSAQIDLGSSLDLSLFISQVFQDLPPFLALDSNTTCSALSMSKDEGVEETEHGPSPRGFTGLPARRRTSRSVEVVQLTDRMASTQRGLHRAVRWHGVWLWGFLLLPGRSLCAAQRPARHVCPSCRSHLRRRECHRPPERPGQEWHRSGRDGRTAHAEPRRPEPRLAPRHGSTQPSCVYEYIQREPESAFYSRLLDPQPARRPCRLRRHRSLLRVRHAVLRSDPAQVAKLPRPSPETLR